jgi:hypothetical protein
MPRSICSESSWPAVTIAPTLSPSRESSRLSIAVPLNTAERICGKPASEVESHWRKASSLDAIRPSLSSSGVDWALPTTK